MRSVSSCLPLVLLLGLPVAGCGPSPGETDRPGATAPQESAERPTDPVPTKEPESGTVTYVVDGDTVHVRGIGRIRLLGVDAPEYGACGFAQASRALSALVKGREVTLTPGGGKDFDRYGRLLRYVDVGSRDAGLSLIEDGWAIARYDSRDGYGRHPRESAYVRADAASEDLGCYPDDRS